MASQMPKNVYDAKQIAYNIANVVNGHVGDAASSTKMPNNIALNQGGTVRRNSCDFTFFELPQKVLLIPKSKSGEMLLTGGRGDLSGQL